MSGGEQLRLTKIFSGKPRPARGTFLLKAALILWVAEGVGEPSVASTKKKR